MDTQVPGCPSIPTWPHDLHLCPPELCLSHTQCMWGPSGLTLHGSSWKTSMTSAIRALDPYSTWRPFVDRRSTINTGRIEERTGKCLPLGVIQPRWEQTPCKTSPGDDKKLLYPPSIPSSHETLIKILQIRQKLEKSPHTAGRNGWELKNGRCRSGLPQSNINKTSQDWFLLLLLSPVLPTLHITSISKVYQHWALFSLHIHAHTDALSHTHVKTLCSWQTSDNMQTIRSHRDVLSVGSLNKQGTILQVATDGLASPLTMDTNEICYN